MSACTKELSKEFLYALKTEGQSMVALHAQQNNDGEFYGQLQELWTKQALFHKKTAPIVKEIFGDGWVIEATYVGS